MYELFFEPWSQIMSHSITRTEWVQKVFLLDPIHALDHKSYNKTMTHSLMRTTAS